MLKRTRGIIVILILVVFCVSMFSAGFTKEDVFASAQEVPAIGTFLKVPFDVRNVSEGMIGFYDSETEKCGFLDMNGNIALPAQYFNIGEFREGLAPAGATPYATGYIDYTGRFVIPPIFDWGLEFNEGKAIVYSRQAGCQIIDNTGAFLLESAYDSIFYNQPLKQYFAYDGKNTDVLDKTLKQMYTLPYLINTVQQVDDRFIGIFWNDNPQNYGAIDLTSGKVISMEDGSGYVMIQNDFLYFNSEEKQSTTIYSLDDGSLLASYGMENVYPINKDTFYTKTEGINYVTKNGVKREVDYTIYSEILPGLILVVTDPVNQTESIRYGVMDSNENMLLPLTYEYLHSDYRSYFTGSVLPQVFIAQTGNTCEVYDAKANRIDTYQNIVRCGSTGTMYYMIDTKGFVTVLDNAGNKIGVIDTEGFGVQSGWNNVLADFRESEKQPVCYVYIDDANAQRSTITYEAEADSPALSSSEIKDILADLPSKTESFFMAIKSDKNELNGKISLHQDWIPQFQIIGGRAYIHPSELTEPFYSFGYRMRTQSCELFYQDKTLLLTYGKKEAKLTCYDEKSGEITEKMLLLDSPVLEMEPKDYVVEKYAIEPVDNMAFVPLRSAAEALGLHVFWHDGLIGVSNRPIMMSQEQAAEKKALLTDMRFSPSSLKALDASLATQPYVDMLVKHTLGVDEISGNICEYTNTIPGYEALINKTKDIILVTEPSKEMLALAKSKGIELEITPFAKEGFVFLLNQSNPVDVLSVQQLKDIYAGRITNWKEVGGDDAPILAYQRNESSGSQTIMENVFMKDEKLMEPLTERRVMSMEGLVDVIAEFSGEVNHSIGYSVYYYATQMYGNDMVKLVKADGILPDSATIADNTYPLVVNYYIVTRKGDITSFAEEMKNYVLSPEGQKLLSDVGLVPIK